MAQPIHQSATPRRGSADPLDGPLTACYNEDMTKLWPHQLAALNFARECQHAMFSMGMGTGKTLTMLEVLREGGSKIVLILCPLSVVGVWRREVDRWGDGAWEFCAGKKTPLSKLKAVDRALGLSAEGKPVILAINYESARTAAILKRLMSQQWCAVVCDESHRIKGPTTSISKLCAKLHTTRRFCLTGTMMPHSPLDAWAQFRFLEPELWGSNWADWDRFRNRFAILRQVQGNPRAAYAVGYKNLDIHAAEIFPYCYTVESKDVLDLPPINTEVRTVTLSPVCLRAYRELERELVAELADNAYCFVPNQMVLALRLQQITGGACPDENQEMQYVDHSKEAELRELIECIDPLSSVVVFGRFTQDLRMAERVANALKRPYTEVSGQRKDLTEHATMPDIPGQVMGVQLRSGGVGIDLTGAQYAIFISVGYSIGDYDQCVARLHRPGQKHPVFIYHIVAEGTVDGDIWNRLKSKNQDIRLVIEAMKQRSKKGAMESGKQANKEVEE